jgi:5-formyltetrahydrofolate cyclo-ligase
VRGARAAAWCGAAGVVRGRLRGVAAVLIEKGQKMTDELSVSEQKAAMRRQVLAKRNAIGVAARAIKSDVICQEAIPQIEAHLSKLELEKPAVVALFSALGSEVDLSGIVRYAQHKGWRLAFPVMLFQEEDPGYTMVFVQVDAETALAKEEDFLAKPAKNLDPATFDFDRFPVIDVKEFNAFIVPLVAFDDHLGRLGYGGGNYDRYQLGVRADCWLSGVAFAEQQVEQVPREEHDVPLVQVITA